MRRTPVARVGGTVLRGLFRVILLVRRPRPIHARGVVLEGEVKWLPGVASSGVAFIDEPPADRRTAARARLSRSIGLPEPLPDVIGLAVRVETPDGPADIEFASTGSAVPGRFLLIPRRRAVAGTFGILLPYRGRRGPVLLRARTVDGDPRADAVWRLELAHATALGSWLPFAELSLRAPASRADDPELRFDAGARPLPGTRPYAWVRALRQPSYDLAQREHP